MFDVINPDKVKKKNYKDSGKVYIKHFKVNSQNSTFFDFIRGGTRMQVGKPDEFISSIIPSNNFWARITFHKTRSYSHPTPIHQQNPGLWSTLVFIVSCLIDLI